MTESEARAELERVLDATAEPVLDSGDIDSLLAVAARPDEAGHVRADGTLVWSPTWDLNAAAAEGWLRKAGRCAGMYSFAEDGQRFERAQMYAHCVRQAGEYSRRGMGSVFTPTET